MEEMKEARRNKERVRKGRLGKGGGNARKGWRIGKRKIFQDHDREETKGNKEYARGAPLQYLFRWLAFVVGN